MSICVFYRFKKLNEEINLAIDWGTLNKLLPQGNTGILDGLGCYKIIVSFY